MPRKKSIRKSALDLKTEIEKTADFLDEMLTDSEEYVSWLHNYAVIRLYRAFEEFMLDCLVGAINNDTETLSDKAGIRFPKHLTDEVCEYIITSNGYFDFKGRDGLIKLVKKYVADDHYLLKTLKLAKHKKPIERLCTLRNFAAHESVVAKRAALEALEIERIASAGSWLKVQGRFGNLAEALDEFADDIEREAPY